MTKTKVLDFDGKVYRVTTTMKNSVREIVIRGVPHVEVFDDFVQYGCIRITNAAIREMYVHSRQKPHVIHVGDYNVKDPNVPRVKR